MSANVTRSDHAKANWRTLALICIAVVGILTTWFSATAVVPELAVERSLSAGQSAWLTNAVQLGFVVGAVAASLVNLPDVIAMHRLIAISSVAAALCNAALLVDVSFSFMIFGRFLTGLCLAGVYPPALKLMATWFLKGRGLALGFLIGALTLGSSMPHLFRALSSGVDWRSVIVVSSVCALGGGMIFAFAIREGPHAFGRATFSPRQAIEVFRNRPLFLANLGYFGHMWELYAMWAWILAFASAAEAIVSPFPFGSPSMLSFVVVGSGVVGCLLGGFLSDRFGRCLTTAGMMAVSGTCAMLIGFAFGGPAWLLAFISILWGISVIGDSAQFSAAVTELADQRFVGTALALQLGIGFSLTVAAIWALPLFVGWVGGWQWGFLMLVPGPLVGVYAMVRLRSLPEAGNMAGGMR